MKDFMRQNGWLLLLVGFLLSVVVTAGSAVMGGTLNPLSAMVSVFVTPAQKGISALLDWGDGVTDYVLRYDEMESEIAALKMEIAALEADVRDGTDASRENEQLRELLNLQAKRSDFVFESARVSARSTSNWESTLTISKGNLAGVAVGNCVITELGELVGVVSEVGLTSATVSTIIDGSIEMGGVIARTYSAGILEGDFTLMLNGQLKMTYLAEETQLVTGDEVLTSGMGEVYPSGLVVGEVASVFTDVTGMSRYAVITPDVSLDDLVEVFVIKEFEIIE